MKAAMILAAGRGERLKPLTDKIPKALCEVKGKPLIEHHVVNLAKAGFDRVVINHAHLGGQIRQYLGNGSQFGVEILYSPEAPGGLETAGGIIKALPLLGNAPFITVNADIYTDFDFAGFEFGNIEHMHAIVVNANPKLAHTRDFGIVESRLSNEDRQYTYAGIASYNPMIFKEFHQGRYSITPMIRRWAEEAKVEVSVFDGVWFDIGSAERLEAVKSI